MNQREKEERGKLHATLLHLSVHVCEWPVSLVVDRDSEQLGMLYRQFVSASTKY